MDILSEQITCSILAMILSTKNCLINVLSLTTICLFDKT